MKAKNEIVHVALVLDASGSMARLASKVIQVADEQIKALKTRSEELDLETRISVYTFSYARNIECLIFDKDVFRLPSIEGLYHAKGQTALIDATIKSQNDLAATAQMYGKHHFLTFVLTDGMENDSFDTSTNLRRLLNAQGPNWSVAALVPDSDGKRFAVNAGFPENNVMIWDVSTDGLAKVGEKVATAASNYMTTVSRGGTVDKNNIFGTGADKVNAQTVQALTPLTNGSFVRWNVHQDMRIDEFVRLMNAGRFNVGRGFYQLTGKMVTIQANKDVIIVEKATGKAYGGDAARQLIGLGSTDVRVKGDDNPDYLIFVKSTANNRKLFAGTELLYLR